MRPEPGQVLHFSEDPSITRFVPHLAATARQPGEYVWAVDAGRSPDYWFPRQCPRAMAWTASRTSAADRDRIIGPGCGDRVHAIEYGWLERMWTVRLYAYRLPADVFRPFDEKGDGHGHAVVATEPVLPLGPAERVGDLFALHEEAGIGLRGAAQPVAVLGRGDHQLAGVERDPVEKRPAAFSGMISAHAGAAGGGRRADRGIAHARAVPLRVRGPLGAHGCGGAHRR